MGFSSVKEYERVVGCTLRGLAKEATVTKQCHHDKAIALSRETTSGWC
jgi:hypothetical protein